MPNCSLSCFCHRRCTKPPSTNHLSRECGGNLMKRPDESSDLRRLPPASKREMNNAEDCVYLPLQKAILTLNKAINLYAVVVEFTLPKKSNGPDNFCTLKILDESCQPVSISVRFFAQKMEKLPHVNSVGDIIRLHHVFMKFHNEEVVAYHSKRYSSFLLFHGKLGNNFNPYQLSLPSQITDHDKVHIMKLKTWWTNFHAYSGASEYSLPLQLKELNDCQAFDLICKVLHISEVSETESILFVWDGTDAPLPCLESDKDPQEGSLPLQLEQVPLSRDVLCTFPCVGTILRVFSGEYLKDTLVHLRVGHWVLFHNMICQKRFGLWEGKMLASSRILLLSDEDNVAQCPQRLFPEGHIPTWSFPSPVPITETDLEHAELSTLMEVLTHAKVTYKYKCVVRVIEAYPSRVEDFRSPIEPYVYRIRFILEDSTARLHAYLYGKDGVEFFDGYPDTDVLISKLNRLLGITNIGADQCGNVCNMRNPPWVQVCIKSYYLDKDDKWGSRMYRICHTRLIG